MKVSSSHCTGDKKRVPQSEEASSHSFVSSAPNIGLLKTSGKHCNVMSDEKRVRAHGCNQIGRMQLQLRGLINSMWIISSVKKKRVKKRHIFISNYLQSLVVT